MGRCTGGRTPYPALTPRIWTSPGVGIPAAADAPETMKQRHFLLYFAVDSIQQQKCSTLVVAGCQTDAAARQHDPQAGKPGEEFLELALGGVLVPHPLEISPIPNDFLSCSKYFGAIRPFFQHQMF